MPAPSKVYIFEHVPRSALNDSTAHGYQAQLAAKGVAVKWSGPQMTVTAGLCKFEPGLLTQGGQGARPPPLARPFQRTTSR